MQDTPKKIMAFRVGADLEKLVRDFAKKRDLSLTEVVTFALIRYLGKKF